MNFIMKMKNKKSLKNKKIYIIPIKEIKILEDKDSLDLLNNRILINLMVMVMIMMTNLNLRNKRYLNNLKNQILSQWNIKSLIILLHHNQMMTKMMMIIIQRFKIRSLNKNIKWSWNQINSRIQIRIIIILTMMTMIMVVKESNHRFGQEFNHSNLKIHLMI